MVNKAQLLPRWQKLSEERKLYIFFLVVALLFADIPSPLSHVVSLLLGTPLPPYSGEVIFEWPLTAFNR